MNKLTGNKPGPGRPMGSKNKVSKAAKEMIADAADIIGGTNRMVAWIQEDPKNEAAFWTTIHPKLLAIQINATHAVDDELAAWLSNR